MKTTKSSGYMVFNYTDNIYATNSVFKTKEDAQKFIVDFRNRFKKQGYYRDNQWNKISIEDISLSIIDEKLNPYK